MSDTNIQQLEQAAIARANKLVSSGTAKRKKGESAEDYALRWAAGYRYKENGGFTPLKEITRPDEISDSASWIPQQYNGSFRTSTFDSQAALDDLNARGSNLEAWSAYQKDAESNYNAARDRYYLTGSDADFQALESATDEYNYATKYIKGRGTSFDVLVDTYTQASGQAYDRAVRSVGGQENFDFLSGYTAMVGGTASEEQRTATRAEAQTRYDTAYTAYTDAVAEYQAAKKDYDDALGQVSARGTTPTNKITGEQIFFNPNATDAQQLADEAKQRMDAAKQKQRDAQATLTEAQGLIGTLDYADTLYSDEAMAASKKEWEDKGWTVDTMLELRAEKKAEAEAHGVTDEMKTDLEAKTTAYEDSKSKYDSANNIAMQARAGQITAGKVPTAEELSALRVEMNNAKAAMDNAQAVIDEAYATWTPTGLTVDDIDTYLTSDYGKYLLTFNPEARQQVVDVLGQDLEEQRDQKKSFYRSTFLSTSYQENAKKADELEQRYTDTQNRLRELGEYASDFADDVLPAIYFSGWQQFVDGFASFGNKVADGIELLYGGDNGVSRFLDSAAQPVHNLTAQAEESLATALANAPKSGQIAAQMGVSLVAAIPYAYLAVLTGGGSAATLGVGEMLPATALSSASGLIGTVELTKSVLTGFAKDPQFWLTYMQVSGDSYMDAIEAGTPVEKAMMYSTVNGLFNAAIEIGGGIQTLPGELQDVAEDITVKNLLPKFLDSAKDEGMEEIWQGFYERGFNYLLDVQYQSGDETKSGRDRGLISIEDREAVISVFGALDEFAGGFVVGAVLGGAQSIGALIQAKGLSAYAENVNKVIMTMPEDVRPALLDEKAATREEVDNKLAEILAVSLRDRMAENGGNLQYASKEQVKNGLYTAEQAANQNQRILSDIGEELVNANFNSNNHKLSTQSDILTRIFGGEEVTKYDIEQLAVDDPAVLAVFRAHFGEDARIEQMADDPGVKTTLCRAANMAAKKTGTVRSEINSTARQLLKMKTEQVGRESAQIKAKATAAATAQPTAEAKLRQYLSESMSNSRARDVYAEIEADPNMRDVFHAYLKQNGMGIPTKDSGRAAVQELSKKFKMNAFAATRSAAKVIDRNASISVSGKTQEEVRDIIAKQSGVENIPTLGEFYAQATELLEANKEGITDEPETNSVILGLYEETLQELGLTSAEIDAMMAQSFVKEARLAADIFTGRKTESDVTKIENKARLAKHDISGKTEEEVREQIIEDSGLREDAVPLFSEYYAKAIANTDGSAQAQANIASEYGRTLRGKGLSQAEVDALVGAAQVKSSKTTGQKILRKVSKPANIQLDGFKEGRLINDTGIDLVIGRGSTLNRQQQVSLRIIDFISKAVGGKIHFYASVVKDGRRVFATDMAGYKAGTVAANGFFDHATGDVYIDIFAGNIGRGTMLYTLAHEYVHQIATNSEADYKILRDFISEKLGQEKMETLMREAEATAKRNKRNELSTEQLKEEVVADAMQKIFMNPATMKELAGLQDVSPTLADKLYELANRFVEQLDAAYAALEKADLSHAAKEMHELKLTRDELDGLAKAFVRGVKAERKSVSIENQDGYIDSSNMSGQEKTDALALSSMNGYDLDGEETDHSLSDRSLIEAAGLYFQFNEKDGTYTVLDHKGGEEVKEITVDMVRDSPIGAMIREGIGYGISKRRAEAATEKQYGFFADIVNMCIQHRDQALIWEVAGSMVFSAVKSNSDAQYKKTIDFSTICKKTQDIVNEMSKAMKKLGRGLTRQEVEAIYLEVGKTGQPTPCPVCYVFSRWIGIGGILDQVKSYQDEYSDQSDESLLAFVKSIEEKAYAFAVSASKSKLDTLIDSDGYLKMGATISKMKSAALSKVNSAIKAIAEDERARKTIQELETLLPNITDSKEKKKVLDEIKRLQNKVMDAELLQKNYSDAVDVVLSYEAYQYITSVYLDASADSVIEGERTSKVTGRSFKTKSGWVPVAVREEVDPSILFDLNRSDEFATKYPRNWAFRTGKGCAAGKAILPYSDARLGEVVQGIAKDVKDIKISDLLTEGKNNNPWFRKDAKAESERAAILKTARRHAAIQNLLGGTRYQSTSDFRYEYGSDYLMSFLEMQAIGSKVQLYTKVIEAVDFLASVGADCNLSVMPLGDGYHYDAESGKNVLDYSPTTGINFEEALKKVHKYNNVQLILVGINDTHIKLALEGDDVTFVIPFHGSGNSVHQIQVLMNLLSENLDVTEAKDYTKVQTDHRMSKTTRQQDIAYDLRMKILQGNAAKKNSSGVFESVLSAEEEAILEGNEILSDLYRRFYVDTTAEEYGLNLAKDQAEHIFPFEYWDKTLTYAEADQNGERFKKYCETLGIYPRFSGVIDSSGEKVDFGDFTASKGYWKLLIDRPMYDNAYDADGKWIGYGKYHEQQKIDITNFKVESLDADAARAEYGEAMSKEPNPEATKGVYDAFVDRMNPPADYREAEKLQRLANYERQKEIDAVTTKASKKKAKASLSDRVSPETDAEYLELAKEPEKNRERLQRIVSSYAVQNGAAVDNRGNALTLYHGSPAFGFTTFSRDTGTASTGLIFATTKREVAANYGRHGDYAFTRDIGKPFMPGDSVEATVNNAEKVLGLKIHPISAEERKSITAKAINAAQVLSDKVDNYYDKIQALPGFQGGEEYYDSPAAYFDGVMDVFYVALGEYEYNADGTLNPTDLSYFSSAEASFDRNYPKLKEYLVGIYDQVRGTPLEEARNFLSGFDIIDTAAPILYSMKNAITGDEVVFTDGDRTWKKSVLNNLILQSKDSAAYRLYGFLGSNPLYVDAAGLDWMTLKVPEIDDKYHSTDYVGHWAIDNGYTSLVVKNVYDGGDLADDYIFFNPEQVKSADPVTYDNNRNVIPLSQRFNPEADDIRFSDRVEVEPAEAQQSLIQDMRDKYGNDIPEEQLLEMGLREQEKAEDAAAVADAVEKIDETLTNVERIINKPKRDARNEKLRAALKASKQETKRAEQFGKGLVQSREYFARQEERAKAKRQVRQATEEERRSFNDALFKHDLASYDPTRSAGAAAAEVKRNQDKALRSAEAWGRGLAASREKYARKEERRIADQRVAEEKRKTKQAEQFGRGITESRVKEERRKARQRELYARQDQRTIDRDNAKEAASLLNSRRKQTAPDTSNSAIMYTVRNGKKKLTMNEWFHEQGDKLKNAGQAIYKALWAAAAPVERIAKLQPMGERADTLINILGAARDTVTVCYEDALVSMNGDIMDKALKDMFPLGTDEESKQKLDVLDHYMTLMTTIDCMSIEERARQARDDYEATYPFLTQMTPGELAREVGKGNEIIDRYVQLLRMADSRHGVKNKTVLVDDAGNPVSAETARAAVDELVAAQPWVVDMAQEIYDYWDRFMRAWVVEKRMSEADYEDMRQAQPHYMPHFRDFGDGAKGSAAINTQGKNMSASPATKAMEGSKRPLLPVEDEFRIQMDRQIREARSNELLANLIRTAMFDTDGTFSDYLAFDWESADNATRQNFWDYMEDADAEQETDGMEDLKDGRYRISAYVDGVKMSAYVSKDVFSALNFVMGKKSGSVGERVYDVLVKTGRFFTNPMKRFITGINPIFALRNVTRDYNTANINSIAGLGFSKYLAQAYGQILGMSDDAQWKQFKALGGSHANYYNYESGFREGVNRRPTLSGVVDNTIGAFNEVTESATRFAEYLATIDMYGDSYETRLLGIKNSAEVTVDFSRKGTMGSLINAWVPYWNPAMQGIDKMIRQVADAEGIKGKMKVLGRAAFMNVLPEILLYAALSALGRLDDWREFNDRMRDTYYLIPVGEHEFLKIPKSRDWGAILGTPVMRILDGIDGRDDPFENYLETSFFANFVPPNPLTDNIIVGNKMDLDANEDFAGRRIVPYEYQDKSPSLQWNGDTSLPAYLIAQGYNATPELLREFVSEYSQLLGKEMSPMQADYVLQNYFGDFAGMLFEFMPMSLFVDDDGFWAVEQDALSNAWETTKTKFVGNNQYSNYTSGKYYETLDALEQEINDYAGEDAKESLAYKTKQALTSGKNSYGKRISEIGKQISTTTDEEEKDALKAEQLILMQDALDFYDRCMSGEIEEPQLYVKYEKYGSVVRDSLIAEKDYFDDYSFEPQSTPQNPKKIDVNDLEYYDLSALDDDTAAEYKAKYGELYDAAYKKTMTAVMNSSAYRNATGKRRAELLEDAVSDVSKEARAQFSGWVKEQRLPVAVKDEYKAYPAELRTVLINISEEPWEAKYTYKPKLSVSNSYVDPDNKSNEYILTNEQKQYYLKLSTDAYLAEWEKLQRQPSFLSASTKKQAEMLDDARSKADKAAKNAFFAWLKLNSKSVPRWGGE